MTLNIPKINFSFPAYFVGGFVRDQFLGVDSKDIDLCVVAPFEAIIPEVERLGGKVFVEKPEYLTVRCKLPDLGDVDIAVARKDGDYSDGRRPDEVFLANDIEEDLSRRDFRVGAIAVNLKTGEIVDPFDGIKDIELKLIRCVGNPADRFREDYLRMIRAIRFAVTKGFDLSYDVGQALNDEGLCEGLKNVSHERIREELYKCFKVDTLLTLRYLEEYKYIKNIVFDINNGLWLKPTMEGK